MEGEDEKSPNPRAFGNAAAWKQLVVAGRRSGNEFSRLLDLLILYAPVQDFGSRCTAVRSRATGRRTAGFSRGTGFLSVDGHRVLVYGNVPLYLSRAGDRVDLVVERNGEKLRLDGVYLLPDPGG